MLLAIDIGNTNTVFAVFEGDECPVQWRIQTVRGRSSDEYAAVLLPLFTARNVDHAAICSILVSSVVPDADRRLSLFCETYLNLTPVFVMPENAGIDVSVDHPHQVGADRLVNGRAVLEYYQAPAVVIDFGTATTFDVIDEGGVYAGGVIAPGIDLSMDALTRAAAKLSRVSVVKPSSVIGKNSAEAMQAGVFFGYLGLIENIVYEISQQLGSAPFVIATGGLAPLFADETDAIDMLDSHLTLKGLHLISRKIFT